MGMCGNTKIQWLDAKNKIERYLDDREKDAFANLNEDHWSGLRLAKVSSYCLYRNTNAII